MVLLKFPATERSLAGYETHGLIPHDSAVAVRELLKHNSENLAEKYVFTGSFHKKKKEKNESVLMPETEPRPHSPSV